MTDVVWSDERIAQLKSLNDQGMSATQIAVIMGGISRNAVIGKIHRLKLKRVERTRAQRKADARRGIETLRKRRAEEAPKPAKPRAVKPGGPPPKPWHMPASAAEVAEIIPSNLKTLLDLEENDCRWPYGHVGTPGFGFCGKRKQPGISYCTSHARIATDQTRHARPKQAEPRQFRVVPATGVAGGQGNPASGEPRETEDASA